MECRCKVSLCQITTIFDSVLEVLVQKVLESFKTDDSRISLLRMSRFRLLRKNADAVNEGFQNGVWFLLSLMSGFRLPCFSLPLSLLLSLQNTKTFVKLRRDMLIHRRNRSAPLTIFHYTASTLVVFTDWRLFVVVGRYRSQRLFRRLCDWYHMKEVFVWATEYRHYSEGYSGK